eukprot:8594925-Alexandrium_andersonii.AAC.1
MATAEACRHPRGTPPRQVPRGKVPRGGLRTIGGPANRKGGPTGRLRWKRPTGRAGMSQGLCQHAQGNAP